MLPCSDVLPLMTARVHATNGYATSVGWRPKPTELAGFSRSTARVRVASKVVLCS